MLYGHNYYFFTFKLKIFCGHLGRSEKRKAAIIKKCKETVTVSTSAMTVKNKFDKEL